MTIPRMYLTVLPAVPKIKAFLFTRDTTPKRATSGEAHLRGLAPGQRCSEKISQRWRAVGDIVTYLSSRKLSPTPTLIDNDVTNHDVNSVTSRWRHCERFHRHRELNPRIEVNRPILQAVYAFKCCYFQLCCGIREWQPLILVGRNLRAPR